MEDIVVTRLNNAVTKKQISTEIAKVISDFDRYNKVKGLTEITRFNQIQLLISFQSVVKKDFKKLTKKDIELYFAEKEGSKYSIEITKVVIKKFMKWLYGGDDFPDCVKSLTYARNAYVFKKPEDMLNENEIKKLIDICDNLRDRAIISLFWDTGVRVGELVSLNVGNVTNDGEFMSIYVTGKSGSRNLGLITSASLVNELLNLHMNKNDLSAPLFISYNSKNYGGRLSENSVQELLKILGKRAGIKKKVTPHLIRHSKLTDLARKGMNEMMMRSMAGWSKSSGMVQYYTHLTSEDVNNKRFELESGGKAKQKESEASSFLPITCPRCGKQNDSSYQYCSSCWFPLEHKTIQKDILLISTFKSKFTRMALDVDKFVSEYYDFKTTTQEYLEFYKGFEGKNSTSIELLQQKLNWTKARFERFVNALVESGIIMINNGVVSIQTYDYNGGQKSVFDNFLCFQKML